jgi:hypothetical protein
MGVIEDTASQILSNTYGFIVISLRPQHGRNRSALPPSQIAIFPFINLALANCNLPAIIWCFARRNRLAILPIDMQQEVKCSRIDVSVSAVVYRAFVFAAPSVFRRA